MNQKGGIVKYINFYDAIKEGTGQVLHNIIDNTISHNIKGLLIYSITNSFYLFVTAINNFPSQDHKSQLKLMFNLTSYYAIANNIFIDIPLFYKNIREIIISLNMDNIEDILKNMEDIYTEITGIRPTPVFKTPTD